MKPTMFNDLATTNLQKYAQVLSSEMFATLQESAAQKGISLELEVVSRLMATFAEPEEFGANVLVDGILNQTYSHDDALEECKRHRQSWLYIYEMEKLRLFMTFQEKLPRDIKESFTLINVKEAMKTIAAELKKAKDEGDAS